MTDGLHSSRHSTGSNTTLVLLLKSMGLFAPHEKTATQDGWYGEVSQNECVKEIWTTLEQSY